MEVQVGLMMHAGGIHPHRQPLEMEPLDHRILHLEVIMGGGELPSWRETFLTSVAK
jgi:hypothetical protein